MEIRFRAKAEQAAKLSFQVTHGGYELKEPGLNMKLLMNGQNIVMFT